MFKKYLLQCSLPTLLLITIILVVNHFISDIFQLSKDIISIIENYALNNHYMGESMLKFLSNLEGEESGLAIIFISTLPPLLLGTLCSLIHCYITFTCENLTGFHADNFQIHNYNKTKLNKTARNLLTLRFSQQALVILTGIATALTMSALTPLYNINTFVTLACCLTLGLGHFCLTFKYIELLINNTRDKDALKAVHKNHRIANDTIFYLKNNEMYLVSTQDNNESKDLKLAVVGDEKFEKP